MTALARLNGVDPTTQFNNALDASYLRTIQSGKTDEPYFVRDLISDATMRSLNTAAANVYDETLNIVRFHGGFIHSQPWAIFNAVDKYGGIKQCTRELADAVLIFHLTEQDGTGAQKVVRRAACLLMFKKKSSVNPLTPRFHPEGIALPNKSDQEQFYLFNKWPSFNLTTSSKKPLGNGSYQLKNTNQNFEIGKYAALWSGSSNNKQWGHFWRYAAPTSSTQIHESLGDLVAKLVDSDSKVGMSFDPVGNSDWDKLIKDLFAYVQTHEWKGSRNANPAGLNFLDAYESNVSNFGTLMQHIRAPLLYQRHFPNFYLRNLMKRFNHDENISSDMNEDGMPIIFASASSFRCKEDAEPISIEARASALNRAIRSLRY